MKLYFAPMEGLTDALYRRVHHATFGGADKYFMPFISPAHSLHFTAREMFDLSPRENAGVPVVPQILAKDAAYFLGTVNMLRDAGYTEVNLNIGCPSGTVTAKGKGAGMLKKPDELRFFLDEIFARSPLPISVKTRIGFDFPEEWSALAEIFLQYPLLELIIHPRTCREFYSGQPHNELLTGFIARAPFPVIQNGNVFTPADAHAIDTAYPALTGLMMGRGWAVNPALGQEILGGKKLTKDGLVLFHDRLYRAYTQHWPKSAAVGRMHGIMGYLGFCFADAGKQLRSLRKSTTPQEYSDAAARLFDECDLVDTPVFLPPD